MEGIAHMVSASMARHGFATQVDHNRLQWSKWSRCESSFGVLLVPSKPGLFALAEEQSVEHELGEKTGQVVDKPGFASGPRFSDAAESKATLGAESGQGTIRDASAFQQRVLTLFRISETEDLGMALGRLFLPNTPERDRLSRKPCLVLYAVIEDEDQRRAIHRSLQERLASPSESVFNHEVPNNLAVHNFTVEEEVEGGSKSAA